MVSVWLFVFVVAAVVCVQATVPTPGDVCFTSRAVRPVPVGNPNTHPWLNTTEAATAFHATRIDWIYTMDPAFINMSTQRGWPVTAAINANVPDRIHGPATYDIGRIVNLYGQKLTAPWMRQWKQQPYYGCINNPDYLDIVFRRARTLVGYGVAGIQHDDPHCNAEAVSWKDGGCYCSHCMRKFGEYAHRHGLVNTTGFNYSSYLLQRGGYGKGAPKLRLAFEAFQTDSVVTYVRALKANITASNHGRPMTLSCNNGAGLWDNITSEFDMGMGELAHGQCTPDQLRNSFLPSPVGTLPKGKAQIVTMPKLSREPGTGDKVLTRKAVGISAALGGHMLVPWDIYMPTPNAERFYGNVSDFADQFAFIRSHGDTFAAYPDIVHTWAARFLCNTSSSVYWVLRGQRDGRGSGARPPVRDNTNICPSSVLFHAVDWEWAMGDRVVYPLPQNPGRTVQFDVQLGQIDPSHCHKTVKSATVAFLNPLGTGQRSIPSTLTKAGAVRFSASEKEANLAPWGVFIITIDWE